MDALFEALYLDVEWYDKDTILGVRESFGSLKLDYNQDNNCFCCNTAIYPKANGRFGRLAFRYLNKIGTEPYLENADKDRIALKKITDPDSGKTWWIEAVKWESKLKLWGSKAFNTAGTVTVQLGEQTCKIIISSSDRSTDELARYLADFKDDLWELIVDQKSYVTASVKDTKQGGVSEESISVITTLLKHSLNILKNPKAELREIQALKPRKAVKPVNRTFMELASKGDGKYLTSRATEQSFNVPENKYILFALMRVHKILKQLVAISDNKSHRFEREVVKLNERLHDFSDHKLINKELIAKDLQRLERSFDLNHLNNALKRKLDNHEINLREEEITKTWCLRIDGKNYVNDRFCSIKNEQGDAWFEKLNARQAEELNTTSQFVFLKYSETFYDEIFQQGLDYEIRGGMIRTDGSTRDGIKKYTYNLTSLSSAKVIGGIELPAREKKFLDENQKAIELESKNWIKPLDRRELAEQERERNSVENRLKFYGENAKKVKRVYTSLEPKLAIFRNLVDQLKKMGIRPSSDFPNSMTFVQNPHYQGVHAGYKNIRDLTNLTDDDLLLSLERMDEIGLINMPILYERWCLVQIIKVLTHNYHYSPTPDWQRKLIRMATTQTKETRGTECLEFTHEELKRRIMLRYEPRLENGKYPDYVMDVEFGRKNGDQLTKRFVMDAKFYSDEVFRDEGGISGVIGTLYLPEDYSKHRRYKNYSENYANSVFILHPVESTIDEIVSPQAWGEHSYYGELEMFPWDTERKDRYHQYGAICASPFLKSNYLDEFQRMIGMFLQYGIEDNDNGRESDDVASINFCIACGSHELKSVVKSNSNSSSMWYECTTCKHFTTYNHCNSCNTRLIKNGDFWSYHSQMPMEPLNIKCPACESLL